MRRAYLADVVGAVGEDADDAEGGVHDDDLGVGQQLDDFLDERPAAVRVEEAQRLSARALREAPDAVGDHVLLGGLEEHLGEHGDALVDLVHVGDGLQAAEVRGCPDDLVAGFGPLQLEPLVAVDEGLHGACVCEQVAEGDAVCADVADAPDGLLDQLDDGFLEQADVERDDAFLDQRVDLQGRAGGQVGHAPGGFDLQVRVRLVVDHLDEHGDRVRVDDFLDRRVLVDAQTLAQQDDACVALQQVAFLDHRDVRAQLLDLGVGLQTHQDVRHELRSLGPARQVPERRLCLEARLEPGFGQRVLAGACRGDPEEALLVDHVHALFASDVHDELVSFLVQTGALVAFAELSREKPCSPAATFPEAHFD